MATPFYEATFPEHISRGAKMILRSRTQVTTRGGGGETRNKRWTWPLREWDAARGIRHTEDLEAVRAFHLVMGGRHVGFRFRDFSDYQALSQRVDTSAGGTLFQLRKSYSAGDYTLWRKLTKPVRGSVHLELNGVALLVLEEGVTIQQYFVMFADQMFGQTPETTPYANVDHTTGMITTPTALTGADSLIATFDFDVPARFGSDELEVRAHSRGRNWEWGAIPIKEIRL